MDTADNHLFAELATPGYKVSVKINSGRQVAELWFMSMQVEMQPGCNYKIDIDAYDSAYRLIHDNQNNC